MNRIEQEKVYKENLQKKIYNGVARIKEIDLKIEKLQIARNNLMEDIRNNQKKFEEGLPSPKPKTVVTDVDLQKYVGQAASQLKEIPSNSGIKTSSSFS